MEISARTCGKVRLFDHTSVESSLEILEAAHNYLQQRFEKVRLSRKYAQRREERVRVFSGVLALSQYRSPTGNQSTVIHLEKIPIERRLIDTDHLCIAKYKDIEQSVKE